MPDSVSLSAPSGPPFASDSPFADRVHPSPNHGERRGNVRPDSIILHYTGMRDAASALMTLCNPLTEVSCHYLVFEDGRIWQLVPENRRAWHAGKSSWHGETDMNSRSIGIEIVNPGHDLTKSPPEPGDYPDFTEPQIVATIALVKDIAARWDIPNARILAHSDIAPGRKVDPGEKFPWARLAAAGLGLWPEDLPPPPPSRGGEADAAIRKPAKPSADKDRIASSQAPRNDGRSTAPAYRLGDEGLPVRALQSMLAAFGYGIEITGVYDRRTFDAVTAFQRHWRQEGVDGIADSGTIVLLRALIAQA